LKNVFGLFDRDRSGEVTTEEIGSVLRNLGLFPTDLELELMLREIDLNGDGKFSFNEFAQLMNNIGNLGELSEEEEDKELKAAFKVFNRRGDGYINEIDLRSVLTSLGEYLTTEESEFKLI
jgi:calmodulin